MPEKSQNIEDLYSALKKHKEAFASIHALLDATRIDYLDDIHKNIKNIWNETSHVEIVTALKSVEWAARDVDALARQSRLDISAQIETLRIHGYFLEANDYDHTLEKKREIVTNLNSRLAALGAALHVSCLQNQDAKNAIFYLVDPAYYLVVVTSRDGLGRYAFEERGTRKRKGSYRSIKEVLPLSFVPEYYEPDNPDKKNDHTDGLNR